MKINIFVQAKDEDIEDYDPYMFVFQVGDSVHDDLTGKTSKIKRISSDSNGNVGYWLEDESWVGGGRHPWELSKIKA